MISHFQYKPLNPQLLTSGWTFSFYYEGKLFEGTYQRNGTVEWHERRPATSEEEKKLTSYLHELMLFHVYED